ncbi:hypothetical protein RCL1_002744 [Eukaryota sp. TZLM3-RCL]
MSSRCIFAMSAASIVAHYLPNPSVFYSIFFYFCYSIFFLVPDLALSILESVEHTKKRSLAVKAVFPSTPSLSIFYHRSISSLTLPTSSTEPFSLSTFNFVLNRPKSVSNNAFTVFEFSSITSFDDSYSGNSISLEKYHHVIKPKFLPKFPCQYRFRQIFLFLSHVLENPSFFTQHNLPPRLVIYAENFAINQCLSILSMLPTFLRVKISGLIFENPWCFPSFLPFPFSNFPRSFISNAINSLHTSHLWTRKTLNNSLLIMKGRDVEKLGISIILVGSKVDQDVYQQWVDLVVRELIMVRIVVKTIENDSEDVQSLNFLVD